MGSLALGLVLLAHSTVLLQNVQHFSLERDASGKVVLEDGKGRCPFDPEYRSTAVMVGKAQHPGTLALPLCTASGPLASLCRPGTLTLLAVPWNLCPPPCASPSLRLPGQAEPRPGYHDPSRKQGHAGGVWQVPVGICLWQMASFTLGPSATSRAMSRPSPAARRVASPSRPRTPSIGCKVSARLVGVPLPQGVGAEGRGQWC